MSFAAILDWEPWLVTVGEHAAKTMLRIAVILTLGLLALRFIRLGFGKVETILTHTSSNAGMEPSAGKQRASTLTGILRTLTIAAMWGLVIAEVLDQVGVDIRPILAGAGILGLAVGFGAQNLVRDLISGFFITLEDQVRLGEAVTVNGTDGVVEAVTFRTLTLRDVTGTIHMFPNGSITTLSNKTRDWSAFVLDMPVGYREDVDRVLAIMRRTGETLCAEPAYHAKVIAPIEVMGLDRFADSAVILRIRIRTRSGEQGPIGAEYRRRLKQVFDAEHIEIPVPYRRVLLGNVPATPTSDHQPNHPPPAS